MTPEASSWLPVVTSSKLEPTTQKLQKYVVESSITERLFLDMFCSCICMYEWPGLSQSYANAGQYPTCYLIFVCVAATELSNVHITALNQSFSRLLLSFW